MYVRVTSVEAESGRNVGIVELFRNRLIPGLMRQIGMKRAAFGGRAGQGCGPVVYYRDPVAARVALAETERRESVGETYDAVIHDNV